MKINYTKFTTMGFGRSKETTSSYEAFVRFSNIAESASVAFSEALFGSSDRLGTSTFQKLGSAGRETVGAIGSGGRGVRNTYQFAKIAAAKIFQIIKAVIAGFTEMIQQTILEVGNQTNAMNDVARELGRMKDLLLPYIADENDRERIKGTVGDQKESLNKLKNNQNVTNNNSETSTTGTESYNKYYDISKTAFGEANEDIKSEEPMNEGIQDVEVGDVTDELKFSFPTVESFNMSGWYLGEPDKVENASPMFIFMSLINQSKAEGTLDLSSIVDEKSLYEYLQMAFEVAYTTYEKVELFKRFSIVNKNHKSIMSMLSNLKKIKYPYTHIKPEGYGQYVAQAISPAGAFATFRKESLESRNDRRKTYESFLTPEVVVDIPGTRAVTEIIRVIHYLTILLTYLANSDVITHLKNKIQTLKKLRANIEKLNNMTVGQLSAAKKNYNLKMKSNYGNSTSGGLKYEDMYNADGTPKQQQSSSASFIPDEVYEELGLSPYGEMDINGQPGEYENIIKQSGTDRNMNIQNDVARMQHDIFSQDKDGSSFGSVDNTGNLKDRNMQLKEHQMTPDIIKFGMKYLHQLLVSMGNMTFQEGRFFNNATKVLVKTAKDIIAAVDEMETAFKKAKDQSTNNETNKEEK